MKIITPTSSRQQVDVRDPGRPQVLQASLTERANVWPAGQWDSILYDNKREITRHKASWSNQYQNIHLFCSLKQS